MSWCTVPEASTIMAGRSLCGTCSSQFGCPEAGRQCLSCDFPLFLLLFSLCWDPQSIQCRYPQWGLVLTPKLVLECSHRQTRGKRRALHTSHMFLNQSNLTIRTNHHVLTRWGECIWVGQEWVSPPTFYVTENWVKSVLPLQSECIYDRVEYGV